jgi:hypothetical protein
MNRPKRRARAVLVLALGALALLAPASAAADAVVDWNAQATTSIAGVARQPPHVAWLSFAMVHGAVYDAVNGIARTHDPYLVLPSASGTESMDAAAATAAFRVLVALFPEQAPMLQARYDQSLAAVPDGPAEAGGVAVGETAAAAMLSARTNDGRGSPFPIAIGTEPGSWRPTPPVFLLDPGAWVANVKPFLAGTARLKTAGPVDLTSSEYAQDFQEVKELGSSSSTTRTADQTDTALFWNDPTIFPRMLGSLAVARGLDSAATARMLASANLVGADAVIACWREKYRWSYWRPVTAIQEAGSDGNPATEADPAWTPFLVTPPFPEYPAGHACASSAVTHALRHFFGTDRVAFSGFSLASNTTRSFERFSQARHEVIDARVWSGIHFRTADVDGARLGRHVARVLRTHYLQPLRESKH